MKKCIINYGDGMWYPKGQIRLVDSLNQVGFDGEILLFNSQTLKCPSHQQVPYAFKPYAFMEAKKRGFDIALWIDASFWAIKPLDILFDEIKQEGHLMQHSGWMVGTWCSDMALSMSNISREDSFSIPLFSGGMVGLDFRDEKASAFLNEWYRLSNDGKSFVGSWNNIGCAVSTDARVNGHRHDMAVGSIVTYKLGMNITPLNVFFNSCSQSWFDTFNDKPETSKKTCLLCQGM